MLGAGRPSLICTQCLRRAVRTFATAAVPALESGLTRLPHRRLLALAGPDAARFLQGLTTNNVYAGADARQDGWYTAFLNAQGRVLCEGFVYPAPATGTTPWACLVEVDAGCVDALYGSMKRRKLRASIDVRVVDEGEWSVWAAWSSSWSSSSALAAAGSVIVRRHLLDTRAPGFDVHRLLVSGEATHNDAPLALPPVSPRDYQLRRCLHGLAEGPAELRPAEALPLESNLDLVRAVDFAKGCYVGQELTVRTKHTGVVRKRILPVRLYDYLAGEPEPARLEFVAGAAPAAGDVPAGVTDVRMVASGQAAAATTASRRKNARSAGKWLAGVGNVGLALCRLEMMTDVRVAAEGMGPASGEFKPGTQFGMQWTVDGEHGERGVGIKAFVPEWHGLRTEEEATARGKKRRVVQRAVEQGK